MRTTANILIVDDEPRMCDSLKFFLEKQDYTVDCAANGFDALTLLGHKEFDVFLIDICMPDMDGFDLMEQTMELHPESPVIVITGNTTVDYALKALKLGAYDFLKKPFEPEELVKAVNNAISLKRLRDENKSITEKLVKSEKRYRVMVQHSPDMIYTLNQRGEFAFINDAVSRILGYNSDELLGKPYTHIVKNGSLGNSKLFDERKTVELVRRDGTTCHVESLVSTILDENGFIIGCRGIDRDITERKRLETELVDSCCKLQNTRISTILGLAKLAECRDSGTGAHLERIREYSRVIAHQMSTMSKYEGYITEDYVEDIYHSSILHDIGKVGIPDSILLKPGRLSPEEFEIIKRHSIIGGDAIRAVEAQTDGQSFLTLGKEIAYHHHEKWDGSGYPFGLRGERIPLSARQVALADVYDALTSKRTYKEAYSHEKAKEIIIRERGKQFDPDVVDAFLARETEFLQIREDLYDDEFHAESTDAAIRAFNEAVSLSTSGFQNQSSYQGFFGAIRNPSNFNRARQCLEFLEPTDRIPFMRKSFPCDDYSPTGPNSKIINTWRP